MESYVKAVRTLLGMTQADVALILSRSTRTVKRWESGEAPVPTSQLRKLRDYYLSMLEFGKVSPLTKSYLEDLYEVTILSAVKGRK